MTGRFILERNMKVELISVILTVRNEERFIKDCVDSILESELPEDVDFEVIVVDGLSTDTTNSIIEAEYGSNERVRLVPNDKITQAAGINLGIKASQADWIAWFGAHSVYDKHYLGGLLKSAKKSGADYTGGAIETLPYDDSFTASIVQALTTHKFGVGNSGFRTHRPEGPADTASYGLFKAAVFEKVGLFEERLVRTQDYEMNSRIRQAGGLIWLNPNLIVQYFNVASVGKFLKKQLTQQGPYNIYMWYLAPYTINPRHAATGLFVLFLLGGAILSSLSSVIFYLWAFILALYGVLSIFSSIQQGLRLRNLLLIPILPFMFLSFHLSHGIGMWSGIFRLVLGRAPVQKEVG